MREEILRFEFIDLLRFYFVRRLLIINNSYRYWNYWNENKIKYKSFFLRVINTHLLQHEERKYNQRNVNVRIILKTKKICYKSKMQNPIKKRKKDILLRNICANTFCNHSIQLSRIFVREEEEERPSEWILLFLRPNPVDGTWPRTNFHVRSVLLSEVLLPGLKCTAIVRVHVNEDESSH